MAHEFCWLDASQLNTGDETFRVRRRHAASLYDSVRENGIRSPLVVEPSASSESGGFRLISGWGRWSARSEGDKLPCYVLPAGLPLERLWDLFLRDNDTWNVVEVGRILQRLQRIPGLTSERIVTEKLKLLGVRSSLDLFRQHLRLLDLGQAAQDFIEEESLPLRRASVFLKLPPDAVDLVVTRTRELHLTLNELAEVLEQLEEIAHRERLSPSRVLEDACAQGGAGEKRSFRAYLQKRRYPELTRYRELLAGLEKELAFSVPVSLEWDPGLERPGLRLFVDLKDPDALDRFHRELKNHSEVFGRFFEVL